MSQTNDKYVRSASNPGVVINTDVEGLKAYKLQKKRLQDIDNLKEEINEIKSLLTQLLQKANQ
jgi:hypothetical protein